MWRRWSRVMVDVSDPMPEFGWVYMKQQPATLCRCERENITLRGVVVCPVCDMVERWP